MERCSHCGAEVRPSEACRVAGEPLCPTCADTHTRICDRCGRTNLGRGKLRRRRYRAVQRLLRGPLYALFTLRPGDRLFIRPLCGGTTKTRRRLIARIVTANAVKPFTATRTNRFRSSTETGPCTWGWSWKWDDGGRDAGNARKILSVFNRDAAYGYIKSDGSLDDGLELVTHPCTLAEHQTAVALGRSAGKDAESGLPVPSKQDLRSARSREPHRVRTDTVTAG